MKLLHIVIAHFDSRWRQVVSVDRDVEGIVHGDFYFQPVLDFQMACRDRATNARLGVATLNDADVTVSKDGKPLFRFALCSSRRTAERLLASWGR